MDTYMLEHFEKWLPVAGYEGLYEVSNCGRVRSLGRPRHPGKVLSPFPKANNYLCVSLLKDKKREQAYIAHLVAAAFIGPRPGGLTIDHKDGDKKNNCAWNLRYITQWENSHAGNFDWNTPRGETHCRAKLSDADVVEIRRLVMEGMKQKDAAKMFGVNPRTVSKIVLNQRRLR